MPTPPDHDRHGPSVPPATAAPSDTMPEPQIGGRWGRFPTPDRRAALDARLTEWDATHDHGSLLGPFDRDGWPDRLTGADVYYLAARSLVGPDGDFSNGLAQLHTFFVVLHNLHLEGADLRGAHLEHADLRHVRLAHADFLGAHLQHANLGWSHLEDATLRSTELEHADLFAAHLEQASLHRAQLGCADLRGAFLDAGTDLTDAIVTDAKHGSVRVADVRWQGVNLAVVKDWPAYMVLGDEQAAWKLARAPLRRVADPAGTREAALVQRNEVRIAFREAARANRQLAAAMRDQGMSDEADHFAYRAQVMQRHIRRLQGQYVRAFGSWLLDWTSGYGYRPMRSVVTYVLIILLFAGTYLLNAQFAAPHLRWDEALVLSVSSFHGRGFFTSGISLSDNLARLAAVEAIIGLLVEITFIATFTQRFFAR